MGMASTLSYLPTDLIQGESINETLSSVTAVTGYTLTYSFNSLPTSISVSCVEVAGKWTLTVSGAQTLLWKRGVVRYSAMLYETATQKSTVIDSGLITVEASPMATSEYTAALALVKAAMLSYASNPNKSISVGTIRIDYKTYEELELLVKYYEREIAKETGNGYAGGPARILTRF